MKRIKEREKKGESKNRKKVEQRNGEEKRDGELEMKKNYKRGLEKR